MLISVHIQSDLIPECLEVGSYGCVEGLHFLLLTLMGALGQSVCLRHESASLLVLPNALIPGEHFLLDAVNRSDLLLYDLLHEVHCWECFIHFIDRDLQVLQLLGKHCPLMA